MIEVFFSEKDNQYTKVKISGHALFSGYGNDIVCAGVSSIVFGALNAFDNLTNNINIDIDKNENEIIISTENPDNNTNLLFKFMLYQLKTIEESYKKNIKIMEVK